MKTAGVYIVIMVIAMGAFIAMLLYSRKNWQSYQENKAAEDKKEQQLISDLVSSNAHFLENEAARGQRYEFNLRIGAPVTDTRYVQERNANMCGDPQACEMYVMTDTKYNHQELWIIYQIPYEYEDTAERFYVYDVIGFPELGRDKYGDPTANTQCNEYSASSRWNGYLDKEQLCRECIFGNTKYEAELIDTEKGGADK